MNKHELVMGRDTVWSLTGLHIKHLAVMYRLAWETTAAAIDGVDLDHLDPTDHDSRRGTGARSPLIGGVHVSTISYRLDMEIDSDPMVRALRAHVAA